MKIIKNEIPIQRTGTFYTSGDAELENTVRLWFCCHGYGQVADFMINKFDRRVKNRESVVSVEGPNKFYWEGTGGMPVATWMTSRYRLNEIRENNQFLSTVYDRYVVKAEQTNLFGFSQGGTTLWRWIHACRPSFDLFINYAGWIPEDIDLSELQDYMIGKRLVFVYGDEDEYLTPDRVEALRAVIERSGLDIEIIQIEGTHRIERDAIDLVMKDR